MCIFRKTQITSNLMCICTQTQEHLATKCLFLKTWPGEAKTKGITPEKDTIAQAHFGIVEMRLRYTQ